MAGNAVTGTSFLNRVSLSKSVSRIPRMHVGASSNAKNTSLALGRIRTRSVPFILTSEQCTRTSTWLESRRVSLLMMSDRRLSITAITSIRMCQPHTSKPTSMRKSPSFFTTLLSVMMRKPLTRKGAAPAVSTAKSSSTRSFRNPGMLVCSSCFPSSTRSSSIRIRGGITSSEIGARTESQSTARAGPCRRCAGAVRGVRR